MTTSTPTISVSASTHPGTVRSHNEDSVGCSGWASQGTVELAVHSYDHDAPTTCVVADGLGGQPAGDVASLLVTRELVHNVPPENTHGLNDALLGAHASLVRAADLAAARAGMATTVAVLVVRPDIILCANVGDTRIYEITDHALTPLSFDDTPGAKYGDAHGQSTVITQALGGKQSSTPKPHLQWFRRESLRFLMCSDGLTSVLPDEQIADVVCREEHDDLAVRSLVSQALAHGAPDNVSVVLVNT